MPCQVTVRLRFLQKWNTTNLYLTNNLLPSFFSTEGLISYVYIYIYIPTQQKIYAVYITIDKAKKLYKIKIGNKYREQLVDRVRKT